MQPLLAIAFVLSAALFWLVFVFLMLARVNRERGRALRRERKVSRMKTRPKVHRASTTGPDRAGLHPL
jgi:hypothetical protein